MEQRQHQDNSRIVLAFVLIGIGMLWMLRKLGVHINFPNINLHEIFYPIRQVIHGFWHFVFSWPMILIVIGLILMAGKRSAGLVLLIVGGIFLLPKIFFIPLISISLFFPILLIALGIALVVRKL